MMSMVIPYESRVNINHCFSHQIVQNIIKLIFCDVNDNPI